MKRVLCVSLLAASTLVMFREARAGGPLKFTTDRPILWDTATPIGFKIDPGKLGPITAPKIQETIKKAFATWSDVTTSRIKFHFDGLLADDVETLADYLAATNNETGGNVIVLDDEGDIVAEILGEGNRNRVLGFAAPIQSNDKIVAFLSLMNGKLAVDPETFLSTLIHEFGHAVGLDHCQINQMFAGDGNKPNDRFIPTMFPTSSDDDTQLGTLNPDDIAWISKLYPSATFDAEFGTIKGRLVRVANGVQTPILGANVLVKNQETNETRRLHVYSCVSDWLTKGNGEFVIPVKPGKYKISVEPISTDFIGGSSVGPHAADENGQSFINPVDPAEFNTVFEVMAGQTKDVGPLVAD